MKTKHKACYIKIFLLLFSGIVFINISACGQMDCNCTLYYCSSCVNAGNCPVSHTFYTRSEALQASQNSCPAATPNITCTDPCGSSSSGSFNLGLNSAPKSYDAPILPPGNLISPASLDNIYTGTPLSAGHPNSDQNRFGTQHKQRLVSSSSSRENLEFDTMYFKLSKNFNPSTSPNNTHSDFNGTPFQVLGSNKTFDNSGVIETQSYNISFTSDDLIDLTKDVALALAVPIAGEGAAVVGASILAGAAINAGVEEIKAFVKCINTEECPSQGEIFGTKVKTDIGIDASEKIADGIADLPRSKITKEVAKVGVGIFFAGVKTGKKIGEGLFPEESGKSEGQKIVVQLTQWGGNEQ